MFSRRVLLRSWLASMASAALPAGADARDTGLPVAFQQRTLDNGLVVLSSENRKSPTVAIQVWYRVGSKDDPVGRSGFAHLFEHLLFKRTKNMKDEMMDRLTEDVGGENNAYTSADVTVYHEVAPSNYLETLLWAEAERMANLQVESRSFASERDVVKEEYRQDVLAPPYGRLDDLIDRRSWQEHPYKRPTIGNIAELDAATLDDVRAFHRTFYRPDNATLVVVGDFDTAQLDQWVDRHFGRIARPDAVLPQVSTREPERDTERRYDETGPSVPLPAVALTFLLPPFHDAALPALRLLEAVLASGESSRLYRTLVYGQQVASEATAYVDPRADASLLIVRGITASGKSVEALERAMTAQIARLRTEAVTDAELDRVRQRLRTAALRTRETAEGIAGALGEAAVLGGDPGRVNTDLERLERVTADEILQVAARYLRDDNRVVIRYARGAEQPAPALTPAPLPAEAPAPFAPEETPPPPAPPRRIIIPALVAENLANGLRLVVAPRPGSGLVSARLLVRAGAARDPQRRAGLARLTAALLTKGTTTRSALQIAEQGEALGADLEAAAGWDSAQVAMTVARGALDQALELVADVVRRPTFTAAELERLRAQLLDELAVSLEDPGFLARSVAARLVFGEGAYGHPMTGVPSSLRRIRRADVVGFYRATFRPENAILVLTGDLRLEEARARAARFFQDWRAQPAAALPSPRYAVPPVARRVVLVDKPDASQAAVALIRPGIARRDRDFAAVMVANSVLGGGYSSRLNQEIRINRGLSYGAGSQIDARRGVGPLIAATQTKNESAALVAGLLIAELERLATWPLTEGELVARKAALVGPFARTLETTGGLAEEVAQLALYGLPLSHLAAFLPAVQAVHAAQVRRLAGQRFHARYASVVVVGDGRQCLAELKRRFGRVTIIPVAKLDLERPDLRR